LDPTEPPVATAGYATLSRPTPLDITTVAAVGVVVLDLPIGIVLVAVTGLAT
jgi:hypothetical protein